MPARKFLLMTALLLCGSGLAEEIYVVNPTSRSYTGYIELAPGELGLPKDLNLSFELEGKPVQAGEFKGRVFVKMVLSPFATAKLVWNQGARIKSVRTEPKNLLRERIITGRKQGEFVGQYSFGRKTGEVRVRDRDRDGLPDLDSDIWLWDVTGDGKTDFVWSFRREQGRRMYFYRVRGLDLSKVALGEAQTDGYTYISLYSDEAPRAEEKVKRVKAIVTLEDWNGDGKFFEGSLLSGGYLVQDRAWKGRVEFKTYDLDGDGDGDIFYTSHFAASGGALMYFDFLDNLQDIVKVKFEPLKANATLTIPAKVELMRFTSTFPKSLHLGRQYKGGTLGFEEHFLYRIEPGDADEFFKGPARLMIKTSGGNIDRLTMGMLGGGNNLGWSIELDPLEAEPDQPPVFRVCAFRDRWGHEIKVCSSILPRSWDGKALSFRRIPQHGNTVDILPDAPWKQVVDEGYFKLKGLHACFSPEGEQLVTDEGMYGGTLSCIERIERDTDGATFVLYYSPLFGGLHLKGADIGYVAYPMRYHSRPMDTRTLYHREALLNPPAPPDIEPHRYIGALPGILFPTPEGKRLCGPLFIYYQDLDGDGYFDTYLYDIENNGIYDRCFWYDARSGVVTFSDGNHIAVWQKRYRFEECKYLIENYNRIEKLWLRGFLEEPLVVRTTLSDSGVPVMREFVRTFAGTPTTRQTTPRFYIIFEKEWIPVAKIDVFHGEGRRYTWTDFSPTGFTRLGTLFTERGFKTGELRERWSARSLEGTSILIVNRLRHLPDDEELRALNDWIAKGGALLLLYSSEEPAERIAFNALGEKLGFRLSDEFIQRRTALYRYPLMGPFGSKAPVAEARVPAPWNRIENFSSAQGWNLLRGLKYLSFVGSPLYMKKESTVILSFKGRALVATLPLKKGLVLVSGVNLWSNKYIFHPFYLEPQMENGKLIRRIVRILSGKVAGFRVRSLSVGKGSTVLEVEGRGGRAKFPRIWSPHTVSVNGIQVKTEALGLFEILTLEPGKSRVEIKGEKP